MCIHIYLANLLKFIKYAKCGYAWLKMGMDIGLYMWIWWSILVCNYIYIYIYIYLDYICYYPNARVYTLNSIVNVVNPHYHILKMAFE